MSLTYSKAFLDLNEFSSIFSKVHLSYFRHQKTTLNFLSSTLMGSMRGSNEKSPEGATFLANFSKY